MPADKLTKERASRIALDYFKRGDWLLWCKRGFAGLLAAAAAAWLITILVQNNHTAFSPGELAQAHAAYDRQCTECHVPFEAMRSDAWIAENRVSSKIVDDKCRKCHKDATDHHARQIPAETACAECHVDHHGRQAPLTRLADNTCTFCHANLAEHSSAPTRFQNVSHFDAENHPKFRSLGADPGRLKFSHRRHLAIGLSYGPENRGDAMTIDRIPMALRAQYERFAGSGGVLELDCSACHEPSPADRRANAVAGQPSPHTGAYMAPVKYETNCQACHPLAFEPTAGKLLEPGSSDLIPHRLPMAQIEQFLQGRYSSRLLQQDPGLLDQVTRSSVVPNKRAKVMDETLRDELAKNLSTARFHVQAVCAKCHEYELPPTQDDPLPPIEKTLVPDVWLTHARFNHAAHRSVAACRECHAVTAPRDANTTLTADSGEAPSTTSPAHEPDGRLDNQQVLIPGIEICLDCHTSTPAKPNLPGRPARTDCVECHWYHGRQDAPPQAASDAVHLRELSTRTHAGSQSVENLQQLLRQNR